MLKDDESLVERVQRKYVEDPATVKRMAFAAVLVLVVLPAFLYYLTWVEARSYEQFTRGYYAFRNGNMEASRDVMNNIVKLTPNSKYTPLARFYLALSYKGFDESRGIEQLEEFLKLYSKHFLRERVYSVLASVLLQANRPADVVSKTDQYTQEFGKSGAFRHEVIYKRAVAMEMLNRGGDAGEIYRELIAEKDKSGMFGILAGYALDRMNIWAPNTPS